MLSPELENFVCFWNENIMEWKPLSIPIEKERIFRGKNDIWLHTHDDDDGDDDEMLVVKWKQIYTNVHALVTSNLSV